jgi:hypothetical protein
VTPSAMIPGGLSPDERVVMDHLMAAWNAFTVLPSKHPDDVHEFRHAIHRLQHLVMIRQLREIFPDYYVSDKQA